MSSRAVVIKGRYRVPASALHLAGFRRWVHSKHFPRRGRVSFISGEVHLEMSPKEIRSHNAPKRDVTNQLCHHAFRQDVGEVFADGVMLFHDEAELATEPDVMFCRWETLESGRMTLVERSPGSGRQVEIHGSPDLVVEIVSKSSVKKDTEMLRDAYFRAGIGEYWLIDARGKDIDFRMLRAGDNGFHESESDADSFRFSAALQRRVKLSRELNRIGGWRYTLDIREDGSSSSD